MSVNVGETIRAALMIEGQGFVVDAEQVQNRRLRIVHVNGIFDDVKTEFVSFSVTDSTANSAVCHPH